MTITLVSTFDYLINFLNNFMKEYNLMFINQPAKTVMSAPLGKEIDLDKLKDEINKYLALPENIEENWDNCAIDMYIGNDDILKLNIKHKKLFENNNTDFIKIEGNYNRTKIQAVYIHEVSKKAKSIIAKEIMKKLKTYTNKHYKIGMETKEEGWENANEKHYSKFYWSEDIIGKDEIYDLIGGSQKLKPIE